MQKTEVDIYKELIASSREYVELLEKSIQAKDAEIKMLKEKRETFALYAVEYGYMLCERGNSLATAVSDIKKMLKGGL